jgi:hypothetical protein
MMRKLRFAVAASLQAALLTPAGFAMDGSKQEPSYMEVKIQPEKSKQNSARKRPGRLKGLGAQQNAKAKLLTSPLWGLR